MGDGVGGGVGGKPLPEGSVRLEVAELERETALLRQQSELETAFQIKLQKHGDGIRAAMQAELAMEQQNKRQGVDRNKGLLEIEQMSSSSDEEVTLLRKQLVQARKDLDDAVAAKNLLELEIAGYERLLSGTAGAGGDGRATRDKNAIGGVAKALGGLGSAMGF